MLKNLNLGFLRLSSGVMYLSIIDIVKSDTSLQACAQCWEMVCKEKKIHIYSFFFGFMLKNSIHLNLGLFLFLFLFIYLFYFLRLSSGVMYLSIIGIIKSDTNF